MTIIQLRKRVAEYLISLGINKSRSLVVDQDLLVTRDRLAGMSDALKLADIVLPKRIYFTF